MKKIVMIPLIFSLNALFGMDNNNNKDIVHEEIDWPAHKELFFKWYGHGPIETEERWECFKKGVQAKEIEMTPVRKTDPIFDKHYYLAYTKKIALYRATTRFMYPSPNNPYSGYPLEDTDVLYTIDQGGRGSLLVNAQWNTNCGENNEQALPRELHPPQEYFPNWKDNKDLWIYWTNIKNQEMDLTRN